jgi:hypothetical protein
MNFCEHLRHNVGQTELRRAKFCLQTTHENARSATVMVFFSSRFKTTSNTKTGSD